MLAALCVTLAVQCVVIVTPVSAALCVGVLTAIAWRCGAPRSWRSGVLGWLMGITAGLIVAFRAPGVLLVPAVGLGYVIHLLGDIVTASGAPVLLPFSGRKVSAPLLGFVGSRREVVLGRGMIVILGLAGWLYLRPLLPR